MRRCPTTRFEPRTWVATQVDQARDQKPISRKNFVELCERLTVEDEAQFEALWRYLA